jgi:hypothetical protein
MTDNHVSKQVTSAQLEDPAERHRALSVGGGRQAELEPPRALQSQCKYIYMSTAATIYNPMVPRHSHQCVMSYAPSSYCWLQLEEFDITTTHAAGAATPTACTQNEAPAHLRRLDQPWLEVRHIHCRLLLQAVAAPQ